MTPDYRRIHELEYELGFRDDPPPPVFTDEPGAVIYYDPGKAKPQTLSDMDVILRHCSATNERVRKLKL